MEQPFKRGVKTGDEPIVLALGDSTHDTPIECRVRHVQVVRSAEKKHYWQMLGWGESPLGSLHHFSPSSVWEFVIQWGIPHFTLSFSSVTESTGNRLNLGNTSPQVVRKFVADLGWIVRDECRVDVGGFDHHQHEVLSAVYCHPISASITRS